MTDSRLLLVVAPQNTVVGYLDELEGAARALAEVLQQNDLGRCLPAPAGGVALLYGTEVTQVRIEAAVRAAARRAGDVGATLVLAFLGHGMAPPGRSELYVMGADTKPDVLSTAVNVGHLIIEAADQPGVNGVIGLVDTCHAAGAVPDVKALVAGVRGGRTRVSLLMASGADQKAYDLVFSRQLTELLRQGLSGAGKHMGVSALREALRHVVTGQDVVSLEHDGDHFAVDELWLSHNPRLVGADRPGPGKFGNEDLRLALEAVGPAVTWPEPWTLHELDRVRHEIQRIKETGTGIGPAALVQRAVHIVDGLRICLVSRSFLASWMGSKLTTQRLRKALPAMPADAHALVPHTTGTALLTDLLELLVLRAPRVGDSRTALLTSFVAALGADAGLDLSAPEVATWADVCGAQIELNDTQENLSRGQAERRLRLVVSLHATVADDWPESLDLWLLDDGAVCERAEIACAPTQAAVEAKVGEAVAWARKHARQRRAPLKTRGRRRPHFAAPSLEARRNRLRRASGRELRRGGALEHAPEPTCSPMVDQRSRSGGPGADEQLRDQGSRRLAGRTGHGPTAGLRRPVAGWQVHACRGVRAPAAHLKQLMELLLAYVPVVLWPDTNNDFSSAEQTLLDMFWDRLPTELAEAYRQRWQGGSAAPSDRLADLRSVWHDLEWLDFCSWFDSRDVVNGSVS